MEKKRESNIELLRIVLMIMIITHHLIVHGLELSHMASSNIELTSMRSLLILINSFVIIGVNCFIFIGGYYGIKLNIKKIINLILEMVFYSLMINLIFALITGVKLDLKQSIIPINTWWFLTCYIILSVLAPYLNVIIENTDKGKQITLIVILTVIICFLGTNGTIPTIISQNTGYNLINFIYIYILARFMNKNINIQSWKISFLCYVIMVGINYCIVTISFKKINSMFAWRMFGYNNAIIIAASVFFFYTFKNINIKENKIINYIATSTIGVYMIHDHPIVRGWIYNKFLHINELINNKYVLVYVIIFAILIFIMALIIDKIRKKLIRILLEILIKIKNINKLIG